MRHPVDYAPSQDFGDNPTRNLPASHWIIKTFGNYQPDGHTGIDYPCPVGTPVRAAADGVVRHVGKFGGGYSDNPWWIQPSFAGYTYVVDHGHFIGIYGHCQGGGARVRVGQEVIEGQVLGMSGNTGASTGPHLHFEVLPDGYILGSAMYGRMDPNTLLAAGSITPQGTTITPIQEDELSAQAEQDIARIKQILEAQEGDRIRERIIAIDDRTAVSGIKYLKGDQDATLYSFEGGKLRGIKLVEWQATGQGYRTLPQDIINALPKAG